MPGRKKGIVDMKLNQPVARRWASRAFALAIESSGSLWSRLAVFSFISGAAASVQNLTDSRAN